MSNTETIPVPYLPDEAKRVTFPNGHTFVFVPKNGDVFNISTWVKTGSLNENDEINGISHFLEHLLFKGTDRFKPGEFDLAMESMGAVINAATWKDFTFYYITGPQGRIAQDADTKSDLSENFELALDMHADMMLGASLPDEEIGPPYDPFDANYKGEKRERSVVIEEIGMREDQPWTKVYNALNHMMYPDGHPYQRDVIGTRSIIGKISRSTIEDYYRRWYSPQNLTTLVVGEFDFEVLEKKILHYFDFQRYAKSVAKLGSDSEPLSSQKDGNKDDGSSSQTIEAWNASTSLRYQEISGDYQTCFFIMGFHGPEPKNLKESIILDAVSHVLGESRSSRLTQALLEKPATPIYNAVSCGQSTFKRGNVFFIQGNFNMTEGGPSVREILKQLEDEVKHFLDEEPLTEEELRRTIKKLKVGFAETSETVSSLAETLGEALTVMDSLDSYTQYLKILGSLNTAEVNQVARQYLSLDKAYVVVML